MRDWLFYWLNPMPRSKYHCPPSACTTLLIWFFAKLPSSWLTFIDRALYYARNK